MSNSVYVVSVSWVSDGDSVNEIQNVYTSRKEAYDSEDLVRRDYEENYGPYFWDDNDLVFNVSEANFVIGG